jgi:very-short-patch-repair endonuclease
VRVGCASQLLARTTVERVVTVYASDAAAVRREVVAGSSSVHAPLTTISLHWKTAPPLEQELSQLVDAMAQAAKELWPRWYATVEERFEHEHWPNTELELRLIEATYAAPSVSASWFRKAWRACQAGKVPLVPHIAAAEQLRQLALALDPRGPLVLLLVSDADAPPTRLHALARGAEWIASQAKVAVILVVPEAWRGNAELDPVNYDAITWESSAPQDSSKDDEPPLPLDAPRILVEPTIGVPHPASRAEQKLFEFLKRDPSLGGLFCFNRQVMGFSNQPYRVDLVCLKHRIVVEIDGDEHRSLRKYREDRDRDYRLLRAGYLTLRVTNEDVMDDIELVLEKLRSIVHLRASNRNGQHDLSS